MNEQWTAKTIADGILTWRTWPGIEGHHCRGCGCEMNVLGMSYDHKCPVCDPEGKHYQMNSLHHEGRLPFERPKFGPSMATVRAGSCLARKINESRREFAVGDRVRWRESWPYRGSERHSAMVVAFNLKFTYPGGSRAYDVRFECGTVQMCHEHQLTLVSRRWQTHLAVWLSDAFGRLSVELFGRRLTSVDFA